MFLAFELGERTETSEEKGRVGDWPEQGNVLFGIIGKGAPVISDPRKDTYRLFRGAGQAGKNSERALEN